MLQDNLDSKLSKMCILISLLLKKRIKKFIFLLINTWNKLDWLENIFKLIVLCNCDFDCDWEFVYKFLSLEIIILVHYCKRDKQRLLIHLFIFPLTLVFTRCTTPNMYWDTFNCHSWNPLCLTAKGLWIHVFKAAAPHVGWYMQNLCGRVVIYWMKSDLRSGCFRRRLMISLNSAII